MESEDEYMFENVEPLKNTLRSIERQLNNSETTVENSPGTSNLNSNWRDSNTRVSETTNSWRMRYTSDEMRQWKWNDRRKKEMNQNDMDKQLSLLSEKTKQLLLRNDNEDETSKPGSSVNYRNKHSNNNQNEKSYQEIKTRDRSKKPSITISLREVLNLETKVPEQVILELLEKLESFKRIIGGNLSFEDVVLLLRVFDKICSSYFDENRGKLIIIIVNGKFLDKISEYLLLLPTQTSLDKNKNKFFWENPEKFWSNLLILYENIFEFMPTTAREVLPKIVKATIISINNAVTYQKIQLSTNVKEKLEKFEETLTASIEKQIQIENNVEVEDPPDNFRLINVYPNVEEITSREVPFIRPIIKNGAYQSVEHYLDVQFRLLKEDFTASLRNGICTYLARQGNEQSEKQFDVRIYEKVQFISPHVTRDKVASLLQYTTKIDKKSVEENSKRFIFGSLLCFTANNFENISFGTVVDNDKKFLRNGQIIVDIKQGHIDYNKKYIMVECTVFFEPYFQVLMALKKIHEDNFPFKDYIVDVTPNTKPPNYIKKTTVAHFKKDLYKFKILSPETWPRPEQVGLNESQFKAFQSALSHEFCIIQGPPGTGKTYTTHRIVEFLLRNKSELRYTGPIFVICFTNHALDQFLEGILPFTPYLLRVGGQSKNPIMEKYSLIKYREILRKVVSRQRNHRHRRYRVEDEFDSDEEKYDFSDYCHTRNEAAEDYFACVELIEDRQKLLNAISSFNGVINFKYLIRYGIVASSNEIMDWLMENDKKIDFDTEENKENFEEEQSEDEEDDIEMYQLNDAERKLDDDLEIIHAELKSKSGYYCLAPKDYQNLICTYEGKIRELEAVLEKDKDNEHKKNIYLQYIQQIAVLKEKMHYLTWRLIQSKTQKEAIVPDQNIVSKQMKADDRWNLYRHWLCLLRVKVCDEMSAMGQVLRSSHRAYQEIAQLRDMYIMRKMHVIGMTITGAARHQKILHTLKFPIVIVEEAAEVLESHIVVSLTNHCQHLILIGDHKQLRPNTAQYNLAIKYNLEISLFERMVQNGIHCQQLNIQHRMRPEIAKLIVPAIYPKLDNSPSVENFPPILGVTKNLFFINHWEYEDYEHNSTSHKNVYEAKYIIRLASYFIKQGYRPEEITILTTYKGQMYLLMEERKGYYELQNVRITVVDNFQGEENKIILLSLVRSNREANIGFLKIENRVCVALSRAKEGFFIIGNMNNLEKSSSIWPKVKKTLVDQDAIGVTLTLQCQIHFTNTNIQTWKDFEQVPEGGCSLPCNTTLKCGHICTLLCHPYDTEHERYACQELCTKTCPRGHPCQNDCYMLCSPCSILLKTNLPCGHVQSIPCSVKPEEYLCRAKVLADLPCGHTCNKNCYEDSNYVKCSYPCEKLLNCGHECQSQCHVKNDPEHLKYICKEPCKKIKKGCSTNEHICPMKCSEECPPCEELVEKRRTTCTHKVRVQCNEEIDGTVCREKCRKTLPCGHHCPKLCFDECGDCKVMITRTIEACGHTITTRCSNVADTNTTSCTQQCTKQLKCGHPCTNKCNEPCTEKCTKIIRYTNLVTNKMVIGFCYRKQESIKLDSDTDSTDSDSYCDND